MGQLLETKNLTKSFGGVNAVDDLDFHIEEGEILGIIGPNGSGKTTLFNLIAGFHQPNSGTIIFQGKDITGLAPHRIAKKGIIRSFQLNLLFSGFTVLKNVDVAYHLHRKTGPIAAFLGTRKVREEEKELLEKARNILELVGMSDREDQFALELSYGWQKTLTIAIGIAADAKLLMLDEPITGIAPNRVEAIAELIRIANRQGTTICLIEHNVALIMSLCDRIVALNFGQKMADGLPEEVAHNKDVVQAYLGI